MLGTPLVILPLSIISRNLAEFMKSALIYPKGFNSDSIPEGTQLAALKLVHSWARKTIEKYCRTGWALDLFDDVGFSGIASFLVKLNEHATNKNYNN